MKRSLSIIFHRVMNCADICMIRLIPLSKFQIKQVHISFDDVHDSFKNVIDKSCQSIFEIPFFNRLKKLHAKYGAKFSLYIFEDPSILYSSKIMSELYENSWLKIGYHAGINGTTSVESVERFLSTFERTESISDKTRLHRFSADPEVIKKLKEAGVKEVFCADDNRNSYGIPSSDFLSVGVPSAKRYFILRRIFDWSIFVF